MVLVGALARLGAVQNPCLPIYRERELRFVLGQVQPACSWSPGTCGASTTRRWRRASSTSCAPRRARRHGGGGRPRPARGRPRRRRRPPPAPSARRAQSAGVLHVGHDRRSQGRAAHRRLHRGRRPGRSADRYALTDGRSLRRWSSPSPTSAASAMLVLPAPARVARGVRRQCRSREHSRADRQARGHGRRRRHAHGDSAPARIAAIRTSAAERVAA